MQNSDKDAYFGSWTLRRFFSMNSIIKNTSSLGIVTRKLQNETIKQDFRHYRNKNGFDRILMITVDDNQLPEKDDCHVWITNGIFFSDFLEKLHQYGEISDDDFDILQKSMDSKGVILQKSEDSKATEPSVRRTLSEEDEEELNRL